MLKDCDDNDNDMIGWFSARTRSQSACSRQYNAGEMHVGRAWTDMFAGSDHSSSDDACILQTGRTD